MRGVTPATPRVYCGKMAFQWLQIFTHCHNPTLTGFTQWAFPDGLPLCHQPYYVPAIFEIINGQFAIVQKQMQAASK